MKLFDFIAKSPEAYHTVATMEEELQAQGYERLYEDNVWHLPNEKYYVVRGDSSIIAFRLPGKMPEGFHIVAAHTDSPAFKIKEHPEVDVEKHYIKLNTEKYGGMLMSSWLDRPLSLAGRVTIQENGTCETKLLNVDRDLLVIPNLAIHMNREVNKGYTYEVAKDLCPLFAHEGTVRELIASELKVKEEKILGMDLFLYNRMAGTYLGKNQEFICAPRLDDLQCVYAALQSFLITENPNKVSILAAFDSEEVGSGTRQGAGSDFLPNVLERIADAREMNRQQYLSAVSRSFLVSADNAHGVHPNHTQKADTTNRPYLGGGVVIKYHGEGKYITDGATGAWFKNLCQNAKVPYQEYFNHSDIVGGSTLGHIATERMSMRGVDIGLAQLAMHSSYETAGAHDTEALIKALIAFYQES